jgi:membrane associated rhomboid family serine protease
MSQYRQSPFANLTPVVKNLLIINVICFIPVVLLDKGDALNPGPITTLFGMHYFGSDYFKVWQIITYMFMHGGFAHILFNMFALFMFGPILEYALGAKRFLQLYFICGIGAGLLQLLVQAIQIHNIIGGFILPHTGQLNSQGIDLSYFQYGGNDVAGKLYDIYNVPLVGASGAIFGVLVGFAMLYPNLEMMIMFIPVPIKAKYIIPAYILIELFLGFKQYGGDNVAHFAHIGGALFGFILIKLWGIKGSNNFL